MLQHSVTLLAAGRLSAPEFGTGQLLLSIAFLLFGGCGIVLFAWIRLKGKLDEVVFFKLIGLAIVITCGSFLLVAGYGEKQVGPIVGLLGTIAGYVLGRSDETSSSQK